MDSTTLINCINCDIKFVPKSSTNVFCKYLCQQEYMKKLTKIKSYKSPKQVEIEIRTKAWKQNNLTRMSKYYEVFGKDYYCSICRLSFEENLNNYGVPLHMVLRPGIRDHRVMDENNWMRYCTKCFSQIQFYKSEGQNKK